MQNCGGSFGSALYSLAEGALLKRNSAIAPGSISLSASVRGEERRGLRRAEVTEGFPGVENILTSILDVIVAAGGSEEAGG